jgi:hypothetical protein
VFPFSMPIGVRSVAAASDPNYANVVSLLHMDGANGSTTFTDQKGIVYTPNNGASLSTANAKFGTAAADFSTGNAYASASNASISLGSGDFTIEAWVLLPASTGANRMICLASGIQFYVTASSQLAYSATGSAAGGSITYGVYHHTALSRASGTVRVFLDGTQVGTVSDATNFTDTSVFLGIFSNGVSIPLQGYVDEFRITKGVARYAANFTPPTAAFPNA